MQMIGPEIAYGIFIVPVLVYSAELLGEIADDIVAIDQR